MTIGDAYTFGNVLGDSSVRETKGAAGDSGAVMARINLRVRSGITLPFYCACDFSSTSMRAFSSRTDSIRGATSFS